MSEWIACVMVGEEDCKSYAPTAVEEGETVGEAIRRVLKPEWESIGAALIDYEPTEEDIQEALSGWTTYVFRNPDYVEKLQAIDPPNYTHDLEFTVAETLGCVYRVFASSILTVA